MSEDEEFKRGQRRGCITTIIIAVLGPLAMVVGAFILLIGMVLPSNQDYEKWEWMSMHPCGMAQEIIDSKICIGKTSAEITKILGEPTETKEKRKWRYELKDCFHIGLGWDLLIVRFGEDDRVVAVERVYVPD